MLPFYDPDSSETPANLRQSRLSFPSPARDMREARLSLDELTHLHAPHVFPFRANNDSLCGHGIYQDDILVVDRAMPPLPGMLVVAVVDNQFLMRELGQELGRPVLVASHPGYSPHYLDTDLQIWGVITHSLRHHKRRS